jgi:hypothetical protein
MVHMNFIQEKILSNAAEFFSVCQARKEQSVVYCKAKLLQPCIVTLLDYSDLDKYFKKLFGYCKKHVSENDR